MKSAVVFPLAVSLVVLGACSRDRDRTRDGEPATTKEQSGASTEHARRDPNDQDRAGVATLTSTSWVANAAAIDRIVASRCAREVSCSHVGPDKHFATGDVCSREVRTRVSAELKTSECPSGIDGKELDECLDAIRTESCTNPIDAVGRLAACRANELCVKIMMPHR
ncbi:MAG: hypothetical protein KF764_21955 [Labilithrix sp.]|nr:hypothetical protein [Labilithrix sp.]MBX3223330.1 hypothetical protein [Labilithrix sp.]